MHAVVTCLLLVAGAGAQNAPKPTAPEADDPGPPVLRRGGGGARKPPVTTAPPIARQPSPLPEEVPEVGAATPAVEEPEMVPGEAVDPADPRLDLIDRARSVAAQFTRELPNFICDQMTWRSTSSSRVPKWKLEDRVEVELLYVDGKEEYRNPRINGKPLKKRSLEETGQWSRGDFGTTLADLMSPATAAKFVRRGTDQLAGVDVIVYDFRVEKANSHWRIEYGESVKPGYRGSIYVDPNSARVLRIEMQTRELPPAYPLDTVEMTVEYGWVTISGTRYLLPVRSENLGCFRGSFHCSKNEIQFRNYRKFGVESTISTTDSTIDFGNVEVPPAKPPAAAKP